jgi:hypothetical protein
MDRNQEMRIAQALNEAIHLRDHADEISQEALIIAIKNLAQYGIFSARQLSAICNGRLSHHGVTKLINKTDKTGGNLNAGTLDILRSILYSRANGVTDYDLVADAISAGTSQGMVSKLTGIPQGSISKKMKP